MTTLDEHFTAVLQRSQIGKRAGDTITVHLDERIPPTPRRSTR